jgi:AcrR family transcriptional regulator
MNVPKPSAAPRGRPRKFLVDDALERALELFWQNGYEGTSLEDLTQAMGISRPSMYLAFGNKEELFHQVLDLYERRNLAYFDRAIHQPTAWKVSETMLRGAVDNACRGKRPQGCLRIVNSIAGGTKSEAIRAEIRRRVDTAKAALRLRFERARAEGDLPADADARGLTDLLAALLQGIAVQARQGAARKDLERVAALGLALWHSASS